MSGGTAGGFTLSQKKEEISRQPMKKVSAEVGICKKKGFKKKRRKQAFDQEKKRKIQEKTTKKKDNLDQ